MTTPYWTDGTTALYVDDCLQVLPTFPPGTFDAVICDPPYSSGGLHRSDRNAPASSKYVTSGAPVVGPTFEGDNRDQRSYSHWSALWLSLAMRAAKPGALVVVSSDWRQLPTLTDAIQMGGWVWRGVVPWVKSRSRSRPTRGGFWNQTEFLVWGSAGPMRTDYDHYLPGFIEADAPRQGRQHITEKPGALWRAVAEAAPLGGLILDPFAGAGSLLLAARETGRRAIGVELNQVYADRAIARLSQTLMDTP